MELLELLKKIEEEIRDLDRGEEENLFLCGVAATVLGVRNVDYGYRFGDVERACPEFKEWIVTTGHKINPHYSYPGAWRVSDNFKRQLVNEKIKVIGSEDENNS